MNVNNPAIKKISLEEYERSFHKQLKPANTGIAIFYRIVDDTVELSFSFDNFIIITSATHKEMRSKFPDAKDDLDVKTDDKTPYTRPEVIKFLKYYAYDRGIREYE